MVSLNFQGLILSVSLATVTIFTLTSAAPAPHSNYHANSKLDACGRLGKKNGVNISYKDVADCYDAIPFDKSVGTTTINTLYGLFRDYYVFTDSALTRHVSKPFASEPVDILKQIQTVGQRKYTSDHQFQNDVRHVIDKLRDGHASYDVGCYTNYGFEQGLSFYAPVENGIQSLRVFKDMKGRGYEDCIVKKIDGKSALKYMRKWAAKKVTCSHDVNARFNCALARQAYDVESGKFVDETGEFSFQVYLPDKPYIDYELQCSGEKNSRHAIHLREEWAVIPRTEIEFKDVKSYINNVCRAESDASASSRQGRSRPHLRNLILPVRKRELEMVDALASATIGNAHPRPEFHGAEKLVSGNATVFYHLKAQPNVGVMVVHTFDAEDEEPTILKGLTAFHNRNVTKLLVDFQGNGGGYIALSSNLVQMLFPNKHILDASFESDMRVTKSVQKASILGFGSDNAGNYNARDYYDLQAKKIAPYENNDLFMKPVTIRRNGRKTQFSEKTAMYFDPLSKSILKAVAKFPWTNHPENIRILTDGRCGSACGMASYFWTTMHNVEAYSIGGTKGEDLSMFSFAGASVITLSDLQDTYNGLNLTSPLKDIPYKSEVRFSWLELYGKNRVLPLEYDAELYSPKHRLDYTFKNSRSRETMWKEVVRAAWK
ncbi:hypothetical protein FBU30_011328 [Linnemannia zychae]|nr:hypothetical protein FBU30_011328 [Linnemannia zychae]